MKTMYCRDCESWRKWLKDHHDTSREIWLLFPKKHTKKPSVSYSEALDEALCYGWIDSLIKRVDDDWYTMRFTPRTNNQKWSEVNRRRVTRLIQDGRMTAFGMAKVEYEKTSTDKTVRPELPSTVPLFISRYLKLNAKAWENFQNLAPSHRRRYVGWIMFAKREETRKKRLKEAVGLLAANQKLGLK